MKNKGNKDNILNFHTKDQVVLSEEGKKIIAAIEDVKAKLDLSRMNLDLVTDDALIDSYIYEIIALNKKYEYFIKKAKDVGIVAGGYEKIS